MTGSVSETPMILPISESVDFANRKWSERSTLLDTYSEPIPWWNRLEDQSSGLSSPDYLSNFLSDVREGVKRGGEGIILLPQGLGTAIPSVYELLHIGAKNSGIKLQIDVNCQATSRWSELFSLQQETAELGWQRLKAGLAPEVHKSIIEVIGTALAMEFSSPSPNVEVTLAQRYFLILSGKVIIEQKENLSLSKQRPCWVNTDKMREQLLSRLTVALDGNNLAARELLIACEVICRRYCRRLVDKANEKFALAIEGIQVIFNWIESNMSSAEDMWVRAHPLLTRKVIKIDRDPITRKPVRTEREVESRSIPRLAFRSAPVSEREATVCRIIQEKMDKISNELKRRSGEEINLSYQLEKLDKLLDRHHNICATINRVLKRRKTLVRNSILEKKGVFSSGNRSGSVNTNIEPTEWDKSAQELLSMNKISWEEELRIAVDTAIGFSSWSDALSGKLVINWFGDIRISWAES